MPKESNNKKRENEIVVPKKNLRQAFQGTNPIERAYYSQIYRQVLKPFADNIRKTLIPSISEIKKLKKQQVNKKVDAKRFDAYGKKITEKFNQIDVAISQEVTFGQKQAQQIAKIINQKNSSLIKDQINQALKQIGTIAKTGYITGRSVDLGTSALGVLNPISPIQAIIGIGNEEWVKPKVESFVEENVALISRLPSESKNKMETKLRRMIESGESTESIKRELQKEFDTIKNRAKMIARDQTAKLNSDLSELRQKEAGLSLYVWRTSRDERVRGRPGGKYPDAIPSHWKCDGEVFKWNDDISIKFKNKKEGINSKGGIKKPRGLNPGKDYNCRCIAIPVFD